MDSLINLLNGIGDVAFNNGVTYPALHGVSVERRIFTLTLQRSGFYLPVRFRIEHTHVGMRTDRQMPHFHTQQLRRVDGDAGQRFQQR